MSEHKIPDESIYIGPPLPEGTIIGNRSVVITDLNLLKKGIAIGTGAYADSGCIAIGHGACAFSKKEDTSQS